MESKKILLAVFSFFVLASLVANAQCSNEPNINYPQLDVYDININLLDDFNVIKKGAEVNLILKNDISTKENKRDNVVDFKVSDGDVDLNACGTIAKLSFGKRLSMPSGLQLLTSKLFLENSQEVNFSSISPLFQSTHAPHANSGSISLARTITNLSLVTSPATFGASLGISFLANAILSACQNGISDFLWGGLDGTGLRFLEKIFRKQPDLFLPAGISIPFVLQEDLKISNGIHKAAAERINLSKEEATSKINKLLEWGDLAGAVELSVKTGQTDIYDSLIKKISL